MSTIIDELHHLLDYAQRDGRAPVAFSLGWRQLGLLLDALHVPAEIRADIGIKGFSFAGVSVRLAGQEDERTLYVRPLVPYAVEYYRGPARETYDDPKRKEELLDQVADELWKLHGLDPGREAT